MKKDRIFGLDLIRSTATLLVIFGHGRGILAQNFPEFPDLWIIDGVNLFFVLSGFLIGGIFISEIEKKGFSGIAILHFWKRRWFRTLPNYYLFLLISLVFIYLKNRNFGDYSASYVLFSQNFFKPYPNFYPIAWSLAVEEWFYILFPILAYFISLLFPKLLLKNSILIAILCFIFFPFLIRFFLAEKIGLSNIFDLFWQRTFRSVVVTQLDSIGFGVLGAYIFYYKNSIWEKYTFLYFLIGISLLIITSLYLTKNCWYFTLICRPDTFGILLLLPLLSKLNTAPSILSKPITFISSISYSLYLTHYSLVFEPIIQLMPYSNVNAIIYYCFYLIATFLLSSLLYKHFEKPITDLREKTFVF